MRMDIGAGYRVYFIVREKVIVILLAGGTKGSQQSDIRKAIELAKEFWVMKKVQKLKAFDITSHLDSEEAMAEYLSQVLEDSDNDELIRALGHIAKAKGMATVAKDSSLGRESLYKALSAGPKQG